ncbi:MAG TPA: zinc-binding dehydrogenase [Beijerinckiaceae bacterium]|nr:zinc-binding dehydrogenase [Beijerinckiaceae bacterium]
MRAAFLTGHGGNEVVTAGDRPDPVPGPGEVLVRVEAATVNRVDLYMRNSGAGITHSLPQIMGVDGAGTIISVPAGESGLQPGQRVTLYAGVTCGRCEFCRRGDRPLCLGARYLGEHRDGTFAGFVCLPAENVFPLPDMFSFAEGAALGITHLTAWRMITGKARMQPHETALIFGIGGGVALAALQLIQAMGGRAIVTSRDPTKLDLAARFGALAGIDGGREDVVRRVMDLTGGRGVDVVIETIGEAVWPQALRALVRGGRLVTCGATSGSHPSADIQRLFIRQLQVFGSTLGSLAEFADLITFCERHDIRPVIDRVYALDDIHAALDRHDSGANTGKVVIAPHNQATAHSRACCEKV